MIDNEETPLGGRKFDTKSRAEKRLVHDRRLTPDRRTAGPEDDGEAEAASGPALERRSKKERRRRIDPTTFEKQYTEEEMEFMNAMQRYKVQTGKSFPSHGEVLKVAFQLGYRKIDGASD